MFTRSIVAVIVVTATAIILSAGNNKPFPWADRTLQTDVVKNDFPTINALGEFVSTIVEILTWTDHEGNNSIRGGNRGKKRSSAHYKCNSRFNSEMIHVCPDESDQNMTERINVEDHDDLNSTLFDSSDDYFAQEAEDKKSVLKEDASAKSNAIPSKKSSSKSNLSCQGVNCQMCCCFVNCNSYEEKPILDCAYTIPEYRYVSLKKIYACTTLSHM